MSKVIALAEMAARIPAGAKISCGGFQLNRPPLALVRELIRQGRGDFHLVLLPNPLPLDWLVATRQVAFAEATFSGFQYEFGSVIPPNWKQACERGEIQWRERDALYLVQGLRAAAMGLRLMPLPHGVLEQNGSDVRSVRNPFTDEDELVVGPLEPDFGLVHAQAADEAGNLWVEDPATDVLVARASRRLLATAERVEARLRRTNIPSFQVEAVAEARSGAWPAACASFYRHDAKAIREYLRASSEGRFARFLEHYDEAIEQQATAVVA
jgi:glutaconate CoA-transferase subunit A